MVSIELIPHKDIIFGESSQSHIYIGASILAAVQTIVRPPSRRLLVTIEREKVWAAIDGGRRMPIVGAAREFIHSSLLCCGLKLFAGKGARLQIIVSMNAGEEERISEQPEAEFVFGNQVQNLDRDKRRACI